MRPTSWLALGSMFLGGVLLLTYVARPRGTSPETRSMSAPIAPTEREPETAERSLDVGARRRTYRVHRPASAPVGAPLWLVLHGSGGTGADMQVLNGGAFDRLADREGIVLAYPNGYGEHWNDCRPDADYAANREDVDDVGFLRALVQALHVDLAIDLDRVTAIGISNGGQMVFRLALEAPELASTYVAMLANLPAPGNDDCLHALRPVRMLLISGSEDPISPSHGGLVNLAGNTSRGAVLASRETAQAWAELAGHRGAPAISPIAERSVDDGTSVVLWEWQDENVPAIAWISVEGGGHSVPTTADLPTWQQAIERAFRAAYGRQSREFEAAEVIFDFSSSRRFRLL